MSDDSKALDDNRIEKVDDRYFAGLEAAPQGLTNSENFCYYPFTQLFLDPRGRAAPCCWNQDYILGNLKSSTLEGVWNGRRIQALREEFLSGKPKACAQQMKEVRCHHYSRRHYAQEIDLAPVQTRGPARLDVRLNGKCNLSCVMCDVWEMPNGVYEETDFWQRGPTDVFPFLKEMDVLGGEPFIQKDTLRLIDAVADCNPDCTWAFVTNGHYVLNDTILKKLDRIKIRWIQVSIDSLRPETYASIRIGGNLERVLKTVEALRAYRDRRHYEGFPFGLTTSMCVQKKNWREVGEYLQWTQDNGVMPILQFAYEPVAATLLNLPKNERLEILRDWEKLLSLFADYYLHPIISSLRDSLNESVPTPTSVAAPGA